MVKVAFEFERHDGSVEIETLWAVVTESGYQLDNIPFYATSVAWGDVVSAERESDGLLKYTGLICPSGHSTVRLLFNRSEDVQKVRDELRALGCGSELAWSRFVAVDVPPSVKYDRIRFYLEKEGNGVYEYEEGCLGQDSP